MPIARIVTEADDDADAVSASTTKIFVGDRELTGITNIAIDEIKHGTAVTATIVLSVRLG